MNYLWLIVGPSGTGKSTLVKALTHGNANVKEILSHTTRLKRSGEKEGFDYYYVTRDVFEKGLKNGEFIEHVEYNGNYYGVSKSEIDNKLAWGDCIIIVEGHGAQQLMKLYPNSRMIFLSPPHISELRQRLVERGDSEELIEKRIASVRAECAFMAEAHYVIPPQDKQGLLTTVSSIISTHKLTSV